jgi:hypothetical protein
VLFSLREKEYRPKEKWREGRGALRKDRRNMTVADMY